MQNFIIDWLEFTWKAADDFCGDLFQLFLSKFPEIKELLDESFLLERGAHGYTHVLSFSEDFKVAYNPEEDRMGVHVVFPGHGMYCLPVMFGLKVEDEYAYASELLSLLLSRGCKITRLDLAYDDFRKVYSPYDYLCFKQAERIRSKCLSWSYVASASKFGGTFYLGTRRNGRYLRIYDKDYESKGEIPSVRYELECRREYAAQYAEKIAAYAGKFDFGALLMDMFVVLAPYNGNSSASKSAAAIDPEFLNLFNSGLANSCDFRIDTKKRKCSIDRLLHWYTYALLPSLRLIAECSGYDYILESIRSTSLDLSTDEKRVMLERFKFEMMNYNK